LALSFSSSFLQAERALRAYFVPTRLATTLKSTYIVCQRESFITARYDLMVTLEQESKHRCSREEEIHNVQHTSGTSPIRETTAVSICASFGVRAVRLLAAEPPSVAALGGMFGVSRK
jgi:hypothetical protein